MISQHRQVVQEILQTGIDSGEFQPCDTESLSWMIMAAYDGLAAQRMMVPDIDIDRVSGGFIETLMRGVQANGD